MPPPLLRNDNQRYRVFDASFSPLPAIQVVILPALTATSQESYLSVRAWLYKKARALFQEEDVELVLKEIVNYFSSDQVSL